MANPATASMVSYLTKVAPGALQELVQTFPDVPYEFDPQQMLMGSSGDRQVMAHAAIADSTLRALREDTAAWVNSARSRLRTANRIATTAEVARTLISPAGAALAAYLLSRPEGKASPAWAFFWLLASILTTLAGALRVDLSGKKGRLVKIFDEVCRYAAEIEALVLRLAPFTKLVRKEDVRKASELVDRAAEVLFETRKRISST